ncbi:MAG TPA: flavin oxidoreductase [Flavobacteriaceae bacterium]|jgi:flavin reductase (DIM6/NTAB) family NADH-FMN oxidoreductase RutF|nr:flavin oxidoreductase [Flavobacteriaceae bacterium]
MTEKIHWSSNDLAQMDAKYRIHLINSASGYKSANLIGTRSPKGQDNLAVFSSVIHMGSQPAVFGFLLRPATVPRHTWSNILATGIYTINHIHLPILEAAHQTSLKFPEDVSEFEATGLCAEMKDGFAAPYVAESPVQMGMKYLNHYEIKENGTILVVGQVEHLYADSQVVASDGWLQLDQAQTMTINGLDGYALPALVQRMPYEKI